MDCPNCGTPEEVGTYTCRHCGVKYGSEDLIQYHRLEFLLDETAGWRMENIAEQRALYQKRIDELKARILPPQPAEPAPQVIPPAPVVSQPAVPIAKPKAEAIPFDQWLLSERNIKLALYSGGVLLLLAGIIFVGINWERFSGAIKFVITLLVTLLLYGGGTLLLKRPLLKLGGIALLSIASGFVPLNFVVLQIYITRAWGLSDNAMWLAASVISLGIYVLTAFRTRGQIFIYLALAAFMSAMTAAMTLIHLALLVFLVGYSLAAVVLLVLAGAIRSASFADFTRLPLLVVSQSAAPVLFLVSAIEWVRVTNCPACTEGGPYLALGAMFIGVAFYIATDVLLSARAARWAAAFFFALSVVFTLTELHFSAIQTGIALKVLALAYLGVGLILERRERKRTAGLPLYAAGYLLAAFVTFQSLLALPRGQADLALALIADTVILALSALVHRNYSWVYGAAWLVIAPLFIYLRLGFPGIVEQGLGLSALMVLYAAAGYALGRRALKWGGPFLTAAAFLSSFVWLMLASNAALATLVLIPIATLYLFVSLWRKWEWLLPIVLGWVDLATIFALMISLPVADLFFRALTVVYAAISIVLAAIAYVLVRFNFKRWRLPLYLVALGNFGLAYLGGLYFRGVLGIGLSAAFAATAFWIAWFERETFSRIKLPPSLSYLAAMLTAIGFVIAIDWAGWGSNWTALGTGLCAAFIATSLILKDGLLNALYGIPLRRVGLALIVLPLMGMVTLNNPLLGMATFGIAGVALIVDAWARKDFYESYLGAGAFVVVLWYFLQNAGLKELQAYAIPCGLWLLAVGLSERQRKRNGVYIAATFVGLAVLMGSAFVQSLSGLSYSVLLLAESLIALFWGVRSRSRLYAQISLVSLIANGIAQFGPAFAQLDRWIQLGLIGSILLIGGIVALVRREQILTARRNLMVEWKQWLS